MPKSLGLIAGSGKLPFLLARRADQKGITLYIAGVRGAASPALERMGEKFLWISVGQVGALLSFFKKNGVDRAVMQGKVQHSSLFKYPRLDLRAVALLARLSDRSGESILKALAGELGKNGTRLLDGRTLLEDLLIKPGWSVGKGRVEPFFIQGLAQARLLAASKIGQTILSKKRSVVAVEGIEGTDETIRRAGKWAGPGTIFYKAASPKQDFRFDIPTIGPKTIENLIKIKARGMVVEAKRVFLLEPERTISLARKAGLFILAL